MEKLRAKLAEARQSSEKRELPLNALLKLPHLNAIVMQANRMDFGVTLRTRRYCPDESLSYTGSTGPHKGTTYRIPPGTKMSSVTYCIHTDENVYPDPWSFMPEQFVVGEEGSSEEEVRRWRKALMAVGKDHRVCSGMHLADAELCLMLASLAEYDMQLCEIDERDVKFEHDYQISHTRLDTKGIQAVVRGKVVC